MASPSLLEARAARSKAKPAGKLDKDAVNYRKGRGERRCGTCSMYRAKQHSCTLVAGTIDPAMLCDRWEKA